MMIAANVYSGGPSEILSVREAKEIVGQVQSGIDVSVQGHFRYEFEDINLYQSRSELHALEISFQRARTEAEYVRLYERLEQICLGVESGNIDRDVLKRLSGTDVVFSGRLKFHQRITETGDGGADIYIGTTGNCTQDYRLVVDNFRHR